MLAAALTLAVIEAGALREAHASSSEPLLPNLIADPPDGTALVTSSVEGRTRLLLRFNGYVHNAGPGALDFRGSREKPKVKGKTERELEEEVRQYKERQESLPQSLEEELSVPPMNLSQRLFTTNEGNPEESEKYLGRPHIEQASAGEMFYVNADGHHHWHLQRVAKYSLWNAGKTAEVTPAQKVGFCLEDSQHVETSKGPATPVYADNVPPYRRFCREFEPNATSVYEGISPGWRDVYSRELALQWVDASNVLPGEYWLREDIDPTGVIKQTGGGTKAAFANTPTTIPGFDAEAQTDSAKEGETKTLTLTARSYADHATPVYTILSKPQHGALGEAKLKEGKLTYAPEPGYSGSDSFTFSAHDSSSAFPEQPAVASVSIADASTRPNVSISGAQAAMTAGTSVALSATVANDSGAVEWEASAGTLTPEGAGGRTAIYTAPSTPPAGGTVSVIARLQDNRAVSDERTITINAVARAEPAPELPSSPTGGNAGFKSSGVAARLSRPRAMLFHRLLVMTTFPSVAGRVRLAAYEGEHELGTCVTETPAGRTFVCRIRLGRRISLRARISVRASLRVGDLLLQSLLPAQRIPQMKMRPVGPTGHVASGSGEFWCSPSTLAGVLVKS